MAENGSRPGWATKLARAQALIDRAQRELDAATEMLHRDPTRVRRSTSEREKDRAAIVDYLKSRPQALSSEIVEFTGLGRHRVDAELFWLRGHDPRVVRLSKGLHTWREAMEKGAAPQEAPQGQEPPPPTLPLPEAVAQANAVRKAALAAMERNAMERMEATEAQRRPDADSRHDPAPRVPTGPGQTTKITPSQGSTGAAATAPVPPPPEGWPTDYERVEL